MNQVSEVEPHLLARRDGPLQLVLLLSVIIMQREQGVGGAYAARPTSVGESALFEQKRLFLLRKRNRSNELESPAFAQNAKSRAARRFAGQGLSSGSSSMSSFSSCRDSSRRAGRFSGSVAPA